MSKIDISMTGPLATITLNRPEVCNALDGDSFAQLLEHFSSLTSDSTVQVIALTGAGRHFCAGADMAWMKQSKTLTPEENQADAQILSDLLRTMNQHPKPIIGLAHGHVMGGGLGLLACCDMVIAADNTQCCFSEARIGMIPATIGPYVLAKIGYSLTRYLFTSSIMFSAEQAYAWHLAHQVVPLDALDSALSEAVTQYTHNGPSAIAATKEWLHQLAINDNACADTASLLAHIRSTTEAQEGLTAFLEKRSPSWRTTES